MKRAGILIIVFCLFPLETAWSQTAAPPSGSAQVGGPQTSPMKSEAARPVDVRRQFWGDLSGFYNGQAEVTLDLVDKALLRFPPAWPEPLERQMILLMMDGVLHEPQAPAHPAVQRFFHSRMDFALEEMAGTQVKEGVLIWKLYNHGFVVRTPTVTVAFDLVRGHSAGEEGFPLSDDFAEQLVRQCDALFVSHRHGDHADMLVAQSFIDAGKPVVAPSEIWSGEPIHEKITHLERRAHIKQPLLVQDGNTALEVVVYPGHQGENIPNNVTLVLAPEGVSFAQTGDQSNITDFAWIDEVGKHHQVDVLMPNCWTTDLPRTIRGFAPKLVITGHENELGHSVDHREPFWLTYDRIKGSESPFLLMTWGESFYYRPGSLSASE